jgi:hypothetical protein
VNTHARRLAHGLADAWAETWHTLTHPSRELITPTIIALAVFAELVILATLTH